MRITNLLQPKRYIHLCETNGDFRLMQSFPELQLKWCVSPKTGHLIKGTLRGPRQTLTYEECQRG